MFLRVDNAATRTAARHSHLCMPVESLVAPGRRLYKSVALTYHTILASEIDLATRYSSFTIVDASAFWYLIACSCQLWRPDTAGSFSHEFFIGQSFEECVKNLKKCVLVKDVHKFGPSGRKI